MAGRHTFLNEMSVLFFCKNFKNSLKCNERNEKEKRQNNGNKTLTFESKFYVIKQGVTKPGRTLNVSMDTLPA